MELRASHPYSSRRSAISARNIVATSQPLAAQAGLSMLAQGGNAVDAAIATAMALTVVEPTGNGLGSDAFAIVWDGSELHGLNASGRAPAAWTPDRFADHDAMPMRGWDSVTVPGAVSAWAELSAKFGKLPFETLAEPAIGYAERGFHVSPLIAQLWARAAEQLHDQPGFAACFLPDGRAPRAGELFASPGHAKTLQAIAETKASAFYHGDIAQRIADAAAQHGAVLTADDMAAHTTDWCGTISTEFDGTHLHEIPPNGQGIAALIALGILRHTDIRDHGVDSTAAVHLQIEAMKMGLRDAERYVSDIAFMTDVGVDDLLSDSYLAQRAAEIDPTQAADTVAGAPKAGGTVYLTAADASGMMVSFIQSNYMGFGSGVVVPGTGIAMQNRGAGFVLDSGHPNQVGPGKRPFHTIIPGFLMGQDAPIASLGVMGGPMQAQGHVQMTLRTQLWGQDPQMAIDAPRWRVSQGRGVSCETTMDSAVLDELTAKGHDISLENPDTAFGFGGAQIIHCLEGGGYVAGSDPRKDGQAVGF